jgi:hypothetical protein
VAGEKLFVDWAGDAIAVFDPITGAEHGARIFVAALGASNYKLNDIDPHAWLADVLARLPDHPAKRINELLPWTGKLRPTPPQPDTQHLRRSGLTCGLHRTDTDRPKRGRLLRRASVLAESTHRRRTWI